MYIAVGNVGVGGEIYKNGAILPDLTPEQIEWLESAGAIKLVPAKPTTGATIEIEPTQVKTKRKRGVKKNEVKADPDK